MMPRLLNWWRRLKGWPEVPPFDWLGRVQALAQAGEWRQAVLTCRAWTQEQPRHHLAWQQLGLALTNWAVTRETGQALLEAMVKEGFTSRLPYWSHRFDLAAASDPLLEAMSAFQQALRWRHDDAASWFGLGEVYYYLGDAAGVLAIATVLQRYDPQQAAQLRELLAKEKRSEDNLAR